MVNFFSSIVASIIENQNSFSKNNVCSTNNNSHMPDMLAWIETSPKLFTTPLPWSVRCTVLVDEGNVFSCVDVGVLVTFSITHIRVLKEPKVGVLLTGNELKVLSSKWNHHHNEPQFLP